MPSVEVARQDKFQCQLVRPGVQRTADASFDIPGFHDMIDNRINLVGLLAYRNEVMQRTKVAVFLDCQYILLQVIGDSRGRREVEALYAAGVRCVENRIEDDIYRGQVAAHDGAPFGCNAPFIPVLRVVAEFEIRAIEEPPIICTRRGKQETDLAAV